MDEDVLVQELVNRLTFEVETLTADKIVKFPNTNGTPLNVKVRVRNKDEPKLIQRGLVSLPRPGNPVAAPKRIQLIGSDQTILSFNVFMEATSSKESTPKGRKHGFHFFKLGGCLGTSYDEDSGPYLPSTSNKDALRGKRGSRSDSLITDEGEDLPETLKLSSVPRNQKGLFGKCKPGGCLDPPFGEDKYPYTIPKVQPQINLKPQELDNKEDSNVLSCDVVPKTKEENEPSKTVNKVNKNETESKPVLNIFARTGEEHSLTSNYSNSIITYPSGLTSSKTQNNEPSIEKKNKNRSFDSGSPRQSFEYTENTYFTPPKDVLRHKEEERKYSRELSNDKIKFSDDDRHKDDIKYGGASFSKPNLNKGKKATENNIQDINRLQDKGNTHQESSKRSDLKISDSTYLTNKVVLRCGDNENDFDETSESLHSKITESPVNAAPALFTDSMNQDDQTSNGDLKNVPGKIQKQGVSSINAFKKENNAHIQATAEFPNPTGETDDIDEASESVYQKNTKNNSDAEKVTADFFTGSEVTDEHGDLNNVPGKIEKQGATSVKDFSTENNVQIQAMSPSNIPKDLMVETVHDTYPNKSILRCGENEDDIDHNSESIYTKTTNASAGLKTFTSTNEDSKEQETNYTDAKASVKDTGNTNIDINQIKYEKLSRDSILSENKEFATSSTDSIISTENLASTYRTKDELLDNETENLHKEVLPLNIDNVIIQNDMLKQERSSAIFQKTPFVPTDDPSIYYDDISKINPFKRNTFTIVESRTSLQKQIEEISTQRNVTEFDSNVKNGNESASIDSKVTKRLEPSIRTIRSDSAINLPHDTKETNSLLLVSSFDKSTADNSEDSAYKSHIDSITKTPTEFDSEPHDTEDDLKISNSDKPVFDASSITHPTKEGKERNDLVTQYSTATDNVVVNAEYGSQLSTFAIGNVDIPSESLKVYEQDDLRTETISPIQSITTSPGSLKEQDIAEVKFGGVNDNTLQSIIQHDILNQKLQSNNFSPDKNIFRPKTTEKCETIIMNLKFQSYINDSNERIVQTLNPLVKPQPRYVDDTVTALQSFIRHGNEIRIPVDPENDLILNFFNKNQKPEDLKTHKNEAVDENIKNKNSEGNRPATQPEDILKKSLAIIYENELIPLHNVIKDLTEEINALLAQQGLLKTKLRNAKRSRSRLIPVNNRCSCRRT